LGLPRRYDSLPFNKSFGTIEINKGLMQFLGEERHARVFEIIAGFNKHYLAVGDRVLFNKEDAIITNIAINTEYLGSALGLLVFILIVGATCVMH